MACFGGLRGELVVYSEEKRLVAFISADAPLKNALVFLGGLTDGLMATLYLKPLAERIGPDWAIVQPLMSSSYSGWGTASLQTDCDDVDELLAFLRPRLQPGGRIVIMGHSTGCQDIVKHLRDGRQASAVSGAILQAPVSDRHYYDTLDDTAERLERAKTFLASGKPDELLPYKGRGDTPVTAYRFYSLASKGGDDDLFSSDFTDAELAQRLGHVRVPVLFLMSLADEYVPPHVDQLKEAGRQAVAMGTPEKDTRVVGIAGATHAPESEEHIAELVSSVGDFLQTLC